MKSLIRVFVLACTAFAVHSTALAQDFTPADESVTADNNFDVRTRYNECDIDPTGSSLCRARNFCGMSLSHPKCQRYCSVYPYDRACRGGWDRGDDGWDRGDDGWDRGDDGWGRDNDGWDRNGDGWDRPGRGDGGWEPGRGNEPGRGDEPGRGWGRERRHRFCREFPRHPRCRRG